MRRLNGRITASARSAAPAASGKLAPVRAVACYQCSSGSTPSSFPAGGEWRVHNPGQILARPDPYQRQALCCIADPAVPALTAHAILGLSVRCRAR